MRSALARDRGSTTAEWALALPAVVLVLTAVLASVGVVVAQARVDNAAAESARLASLGQPSPSVTAHARVLLDSLADVGVMRTHRGSSVCVTVTARHDPQPFPLGAVELQSQACALDEATS